MFCPSCKEPNPSYNKYCSKCKIALDGSGTYKDGIKPSKPQEVENFIAEFDHIIISTCIPSWEYEIIDTIFAIDAHEQGLFTQLLETHMGLHIGANPSKAFDRVKAQLKSQCAALKCDAIIGCHFEHRVAVAQGMLGNKQAIEIFAYGTAVRRVPNAA